MNIIFICNELPPGNTGGIGIFIDELTKNLAILNHKIFVIGFLDNVAIKETSNMNGITIIKLPSKRGLVGGVLNRFTLYSAIARVCSSFEIDIIEVADFEGWASFLPKGNHRLVVRLHGSHTYFASEMNSQPSFLIKTLERIALNKANAIVSVSRYTADKTSEVFKLHKDIQVIHNGIDLPNVNNQKNDWSGSCKVVFSGTLMKKKGVFSIAEAWPLVKAQIPNAKLIMIGKNTIVNGENAEEKIKSISKDSSIVFFGHLPKTEMESVMLDCDVAIYPSYSETFGLAPIEAMALGIPTIYTKLSCGPEIVKVKELIDICVDPEKPQELANTLIKLLKNKDLRVSVAKLGQLLVEKNYSNEDKVIENEDFYKEVIANA